MPRSIVKTQKMIHQTQFLYIYVYFESDFMVLSHFSVCRLVTANDTTDCNNYCPKENAISMWVGGNWLCSSFGDNSNMFIFTKSHKKQLLFFCFFFQRRDEHSLNVIVMMVNSLICNLLVFWYTCMFPLQRKQLRSI